jgi:hypothetical protein
VNKHSLNERGREMKKIKLNFRENYQKAKVFSEDLRLLQKRITGASVYKSKEALYRRKPKHRKFVFED